MATTLVGRFPYWLVGGRRKASDAHPPASRASPLPGRLPLWLVDRTKYPRVSNLPSRHWLDGVPIWLPAASGLGNQTSHWYASNWNDPGHKSKGANMKWFVNFRSQVLYLFCLLLTYSWIWIIWFGVWREMPILTKNISQVQPPTAER